MNGFIPIPLQQILQAELVPNEHLVWQARPTFSTKMPELTGTFFLGTSFFVGGVFCFWEAVNNLMASPSDGSAGKATFFFFFGSVGILTGASALLSAAWTWWTARHTLYAITDHRALLIEAPYRCTSQSFTGERLITTVRREGRSKRGDIIFERVVSKGRKGRTVHRDVGFFGLADAKHVEGLLQAAYDNSERA